MVGSSSGNGVPAAIEGPVPKRALPPEDGAPHGPPSDGASPCKRPRTAGPPESPSPVVHVGGLVSWGIGKLQWWLGGMCSLSEACSLLEKRCKVTTKGRRAGALAPLPPGAVAAPPESDLVPARRCPQAPSFWRGARTP
jgi:hypothetical protein